MYPECSFHTMQVQQSACAFPYRSMWKAVCSFQWAALSTENVQKKSLTILQNRTTWERWCRWASRAACFCGGAWPGRLWRRTCLFDRCFSGITLFARTQSKTDNWPWTFFFFSFFSWPIQQMLCRLWDQLILVAREFFPGPRMHLKDDTFLYMLMNTCYLSFKGMLLSNL